MEDNHCGCGGKIVKIWFKEDEYVDGHKTGRVRRAVSHLECRNCLRGFVVDDSFDGKWKCPPDRNTIV